MKAWRVCITCGIAWTLAAYQPPPPAEWIRSHAIPIETVEAGHGFKDLQPLKEVIGKARIVALGEATHGTREFFQMKHRILEFLASEMAFNIFSIEANMPEAYRLNDYVLNGSGDPKALLKGMYFWTWDTEEVLAMIEWMREFNRSGKGRLQFTGFDMQTPTVAAGIVRDCVKAFDPDYLATLEKAPVELRDSRGPAFGVATGSFPVADAAGKRVRFSGYIRTESVTGYAGLWWRVDGDSGTLAFDNMQNRGATGTSDWKRYELELAVPNNAKNINFGLLHSGGGTAWFDSLTIELDGVAYTRGPWDLDFESSSQSGFYLGGDGYRLAPDPSVAHSGQQSLRSQQVSQPKSNAADPKTAAAAWQDIVRRLELSSTVGSEAWNSRDLKSRPH